MSTEVFLSADIGGTNTRLRLYEVITNEEFVNVELDNVPELPGNLIYDQKYSNENYSSLFEVIKLFLKESKTNASPTTACLAVAGPVANNRAQLTNRSSWVIDGQVLGNQLGLERIRVINDFVAMGYGLLTLNEEKECVVLQHAPKQRDAPIACIGAGTGLGECFITPNGLGGYECYGSEGGHAEFAPRNDVEIRMLQYLSRKFATTHRISIERLVSGNGLANIYEFLSTEERPQDITTAVHEQILAAAESDRGRVVATNADNCPLCAQTMRIFTVAYGAEAGVAGLKWLPYGGLYLTGGLTPKYIDYITGHKEGTKDLFLGALLDKGRVSPNLKNIPIYAVMVENLGERGAQYTALKLLQDVDRRRYSSKKAVDAVNTAAASAASDKSARQNVSATAVREGATKEVRATKCEGVCGGVTHTVLAFALAVGLITLGGYVYANKKK